MLRIGKIKIGGRLVLAPMAQVTDAAFRILCRRQGADLVYSPLINCNALVRRNKATEQLAQVSDEERPVALQLFGSRTDVIAQATSILARDADIVDFNLGCPDAAVLRQGSGGALLRRPSKVGEIIRAIRKSTEKPVTAKIRAGFARIDIKGAVKISRIIEDAGADAIAVHARHVKQGYSGKASWESIKAVKEAVSIPVIGNGDVRDRESFDAMLRETGCDAVMVGRAAIGNHWVFSDIKGRRKPLPAEQRAKRNIGGLLEYISLAERLGIARYQTIKFQAHYFTKGLPDSTSLRLKINGAGDVAAIKRLVKSFYGVETTKTFK